MSSIAVLVAAFNAERWIQQCLDSLLGQTLQDIEVICIDDCSTDDTQRLILEYANRDSRFRLLQTPRNSGQAVARNLGLEAVTAPYVCMVDADDWLSADALASALDVFERHALTDCVVFNLTKYFAAERDAIVTNNDDVLTAIKARTEDYGLPDALSDGGCLSGYEAARLSLDGWQLHGLYVTRTDLHRQYPFDTTARLYSDDNATHLHYLHSREVRACNGQYFYRQHESLTHSFSPLHFELIRANISLKQKLIEERVGEDLLRTYECHRWVNFVTVYRTFLKHRSELTSEQRRIIKDLFAKIYHTFSRETLPSYYTGTLPSYYTATLPSYYTATPHSSSTIQTIPSSTYTGTLAPPSRRKPGYWLLPFGLFCLEQRLYMFYKRLFNPAYINEQLA